MILFLSDWNLYSGTAIADINSKNTSFVRLAGVFAGMGIKNHAFLLALINPKLQGVDPYDPNITQEQKNMIIVESKINPWYFFREVARVPGGSGEAAMSLEANRGNIAAWWCFFNHIMLLLVQPRQTGKTLIMVELVVYLMGVACLDTTINLLTTGDRLRKETIDQIKNIFDTLPDYLNQRNDRTDTSNTESLSVNSLGNKFLAHLPQAAVKAAWLVGRGFTSAVSWIDEAPYCVNIHISLSVILQSGNAARERASRSGAPYGTIITTTSGEQDKDEGKCIHDILQESLPWTEKLYDAENEDELRKIICGGARGYYQVNATFSHRQLGKTDEWLDNRIRQSKVSGEGADRDAFNIWTAGSLSHPLSVGLLKRIKASIDTDPHVEISHPDNYVTRWYLNEKDISGFMATRKIVLGIDSSNAIGRDDIALTFTDALTLGVVASGTYNQTNILTFALWLVGVLVKYKNITCIIEARSSGPAILDVLLRVLPTYGEDPFKRLFNKVVQDAELDRKAFELIRQPMNRRDPDLYRIYKGSFGFFTAGSGANARSELYGTTLQEAAKTSAELICDANLVGQIMGLIVKNGRVDHAAGKHDDLVVSWLLCHWFLRNGINLSWYGINKAMTELVSEQKQSPQEYKLQQEQTALQDRMKVLAEKLVDEPDEFVSMALEHQLRNLARNLVYENGQINSVDQLINSIKENKKSKKRGILAPMQENSAEDYYQSMLKQASNYSY